MKQGVLLIMFGLLMQSGFAQQKYFTKTATVSFYSKAIIENIEAHNKKAISVLDPATGIIQFSLMIRDFVFSNGLMREHFNENYMESDKYPKSVFSGKIDNIGNVNFSQNGTYTVSVAGSLVMHGVTNAIKAPVSFTIKDGNISATAEFIVKPADYNIKIPALVRDNIAKEVKVVVKIASYQLLSK